MEYEEYPSWISATIVDEYKKIGIKKLFKWQHEILSNKNIRYPKSNNLLFSSPTSSGKTLIAELLALSIIFSENSEQHLPISDGDVEVQQRQLPCNHGFRSSSCGNDIIHPFSDELTSNAGWKALDGGPRRPKAIFIFPYISIAKEKFFYLQRMWRNFDLTVASYIGNSNSSLPLHRWNVAVCTIEKSNTLINRIIRDGNLNLIDIVVIDEFHMIFDPNRGQLIENIVAKLLYYNNLSEKKKIQLIGMSGTLPNISDLSFWLGAVQYTAKFCLNNRLELLFLTNHGILKDMNTMEVIRKFDVKDSSLKNSYKYYNIILSCMDSIKTNQSILIFCNTKDETEQISLDLSAYIRNELRSGTVAAPPSINPKILSEFYKKFHEKTQSVDEILRKTFVFGVAFHHAGLTIEEREEIEFFYRNGTIRILCSTTTLSLGVNLPINKVIINHNIVNLNYIIYNQMIGRCGRLGFQPAEATANKADVFTTTQAESIVLCRTQEQVDILMEKVQYKSFDINNIKRYRSKIIIEAICSGLCTTKYELTTIHSSLLFNHVNTLDEELSWLSQHNLISIFNDECKGTQLGNAILLSSLSPDIALSIYADLEKAIQSLSIDNELHLLYLVTPLNNIPLWNACVDWNNYYNIWSKLPKALQKVSAMIGIREKFLIDRMMGCKVENNRELQIHYRFLSALALYDLISEKSMNKVSKKFVINRGALQSLQQQSSSYSHMVVIFSEELGWSYLKLLLEGFSERLMYGVRKDLTELIKIQGIDGKLARAFHNHNISTISSIISASNEAIMKVLHTAVPFKKESNENNENHTGFNKWLIDAEPMSDLHAALLLKERSRLHIVSSLRDLSIFNENKLLNLLKSSANDAETDKNNEIAKQILADDSTNTEVYGNTLTQNFMDDTSTELALKLELNQSYDYKSAESKSANDMSLWSNYTSLVDPKSPQQHISIAERPASTDLFDECSMSFDNAKKNCSIMEYSPISPRNMQNLPKNEPKHSSPTIDFKISETHQKAESRNLERNVREFITNRRYSSLNLVHRDEKSWLKFVDDVKQRHEISLAIDFNSSKELYGVAIYNGNNAIPYYIPFNNSIDGDLPHATFIPMSERINILKQILLLETKKYIFDIFLCMRLLRSLNFFGQKRKNFKNFICLKCMAYNLYHRYEDDLLISYETLLQNIDLLSEIKLGDMERFDRTVIISYLNFFIHNELYKSLRKVSTKQLLNLNVKVINTFLNIESNGVRFDAEMAEALMSKMKKKLSSLEDSAHKMANYKFDLDSAVDLADVLYVRLKIPPSDGSAASTKSHFPTSKSALAKLSGHYPIADTILTWRVLNYALKTSLSNLLRYCSSNNRIYPLYEVCLSTGRIQSSMPNIQSIQKDVILDNISMRHLFSVPEGYYLISADYCQLELRVLAHMSGDENLRRIIKTNADPFEVLKDEWNSSGVSMKLDRNQVKKLCYAIIYGMGSVSLGEHIGVNRGHAELIIENFFRKYPTVRIWMDNMIDFHREHGFVKTMLHQRRYFPPIMQGNFAERAKIGRQLINAIIQGSAAEIFKSAVTSLNTQLIDMDAKVVMQIHDEIILEVEESLLPSLIDQIRSAMINVLPTSNVMLNVKLNYGRNWSELEVIELNSS